MLWKNPLHALIVVGKTKAYRRAAEITEHLKVPNLEFSHAPFIKELIL
jgi:hypothetical protein